MFAWWFMRLEGCIFVLSGQLLNLDVHKIWCMFTCWLGRDHLCCYVPSSSFSPPLHFLLTFLILSVLHWVFSPQFLLLLPFQEEKPTKDKKKTTLQSIIFTPSIILLVSSPPLHSSSPVLSLIFNKAVNFEVFWRGHVFLLIFLRKPMTLIRQVKIRERLKQSSCEYVFRCLIHFRLHMCW